MELNCTSGIVRTRENGYWVSSATSHALQGLEREGGSYVAAAGSDSHLANFV